MDQALIDEWEKDLAERKSLYPWMSTGKEEADLSKLKRLNENRKTGSGLRYDVPDDAHCYFCLKGKPCLHEHKVRMETYAGPALGGSLLNVHFFSYRVCDECQRKLWLRGILMLLCASLIGVVFGLSFSLLMKLDYFHINSIIKVVCVACYLIAILCLFHKHGQIRLNIFQFFAAVMFLFISGPLILNLYSLSKSLSMCFLMAVSLPTILFGLRKEINLFSKLHGRSVY